MPSPCRRLFAVVCLPVLLALTVALPQAAHAAGRTAMLKGINSARAHAGLARLRTNRALQRASNAYARALSKHGQFAHASNIMPRGSHFKLVGEILGLASGSGGDPGGIVNAWLASPEHRPILLRPSYRYVGVGVARGLMNGQMSTFWVVRFGER